MTLKQFLSFTCLLLRFYGSNEIIYRKELFRSPIVRNVRVMKRIITRDKFSRVIRSIRMEHNIFVLHGSSTIVKVIMSLFKALALRGS